MSYDFSQISPLLLVEDDIVDLSMVRRLLPPSVEVVAAHSVAQARALVAQRAFRCALTDLALPDGDGRQVVAVCGAAVPPVPAVVLTAMSSWLMADVLLSEGAQDFLLKEDLDRGRLLRALAHAVLRARAEERRRRVTEHRARARALERLGDLATGVCDALLDRLQGIEINSTFLSHTHESADLAQEVGAAAQEASELCRQLITYTRPQLFERALDAGRLVDGTTRRWADRLPPGVAMDHWIGVHLPRLHADEEALAVVLDHLVENAVAAARPGGVRVHLRAEAVEIRETLMTPFGQSLPAGVYVGLDVVDDGEGIPAEDLPRICDPFFSRRPPALGLGLAMVLGIVRAHHGGLLAWSSPGNTQVRVLLPVNSASVSGT